MLKTPWTTTKAVWTKVGVRIATSVCAACLGESIKLKKDAETQETVKAVERSKELEEKRAICSPHVKAWLKSVPCIENCEDAKPLLCSDKSTFTTTEIYEVLVEAAIGRFRAGGAGSKEVGFRIPIFESNFGQAYPLTYSGVFERIDDPNCIADFRTFDTGSLHRNEETYIITWITRESFFEKT